jgi:molybdopterin-guanine dinucleotide biosynthesis protein A
MKTVGILLAGGQSRRFGSPKAFAVRQNRYFYEWAYQALTSVSEQVIIVTYRELMERFPSHLEVITDHEQFVGKGPLAGIYTAMKHIEGEQYIVLPCDMPLITAEISMNLLNETDRCFIQNFDVCAVQCQEQAHPLVSVWKRSVLSSLEDVLLQDQLGVMRLLNQVHTYWVDGFQLTAEAEQIFRNINRRAQWSNEQE